ncbi:MAG: nucleotidyl transferase AbiEii/AbiGii toxin family protein [Anaerolineales bacterium]
MDHFLTLPANRRRQLCEATGQALGLDAPSVEKDFWVCWVLREMFMLPNSGPHLTFKGGTSLSKGWKLIERFSEDIDAVVDREFLGFSGEQAPERAPSNKKRDKRIEALMGACRSYIREVMLPELTQRSEKRLPTGLKCGISDDPADNDGQTLLFAYPASFLSGTYLQPVVKIELGARSDTEPSATQMIQPYLAEALPDEMGPSTFEVRTVAPERTFWEKAMLLHEETFRDSKGPKARLSRHYYDLWCLIRANISEKAVADPRLFERIAAHRAVYFRKSKEAQDSLRPGSLRLLPIGNQRAAWKQDYDVMRDSMFFGVTPEFDEILTVVGDFERRFNTSARES